MLQKSGLILVVVCKICNSKTEMLQQFIPLEPPAGIIIIEVWDFQLVRYGQPLDLDLSSWNHSHTGTVLLVEFILS